MKNIILASFLLSILSFAGCSKKKESSKNAQLWLTKLDKSALLDKRDIAFKEKKEGDAIAGITINPGQTFQKMDGFGFTLTGGSALQIHKMEATAREKLLQELFGKGENDLGISYLRLSLGASDLDKAPFSYDDLPAGQTDEKLTHFSLANDTLHLIPVLQEILEISPHIKLLSSPWSPPVWMKDNGDTRGGSLQEKYYSAYAQYFVKYIKAMQENNINIDAITVQNEPLHPGNNPSLLMKADAQAEFIKSALGPAFHKNSIDTKIIIYDHNADRPDYPISILKDPEAAKYIDGSAFHLYAGNINALSEVHDTFPDKNLYFTEQWVGAPGNFSKEMAWHTKNLIIGATRNWCKTVLEWNLAADEHQDPHTNRGGCNRCLGALTISGNKITREPAYYIIGQASKFVPPGSIRIGSNKLQDIPNVAFKTPQGNVVLILQNDSKSKKNIRINFEKKSLQLQLDGGAVGTLVI